MLTYFEIYIFGIRRILRKCIGPCMFGQWLGVSKHCWWFIEGGLKHLAPGRCGCNFEYAISKHILDILSISCEIVLRQILALTVHKAKIRNKETLNQWYFNCSHIIDIIRQDRFRQCLDAAFSTMQYFLQKYNFSNQPISLIATWAILQQWTELCTDPDQFTLRVVSFLQS